MSDIVHEEGCEGFDPERGYKEGICKSICMIHMKCEPLRDGDYCICPECMHVFRTEEELVDAFMDMSKFWSEKERDRPEAEKINSCPHCAHDF